MHSWPCTKVCVNEAFSDVYLSQIWLLFSDYSYQHIFCGGFLDVWILAVNKHKEVETSIMTDH